MCFPQPRPSLGELVAVAVASTAVAVAGAVVAKAVANVAIEKKEKKENNQKSHQ